ncbi:MAG: HD domain-containing phosphohydrolase [Gemmatimonadota bacterium]
MSPAARFLTALAQAISTMTLYKEGHPARERALDSAHERLQELQEGDPRMEFTFLGDEIVVDRRPLRDLKNWDWGNRFSSAGVQRVEFLGPVDRDDLEVFLDDIMGRLNQTPSDPSEARYTRETSIRYGAVGIKGEDEGEGSKIRDLATATLSFSLREEADTVDWLHGELKEGKDLHMVEAEAIVRSLSVAMHGDQQFLIPLLRLKKYDQYTTTHALNVSVLSMALAEYVGLGPREVRTFGISGLLHDLGKTTIPEEILNKPGKLTDEERAIMNNHPMEGARIILETEDNLDLAAVVAYEHHVRVNGEGYPTFHYCRNCHQASNMVHVCDVFDALRTNRPYREAWPQDKVLDYILEGAGTEFDPHLAQAFVKMMRQWTGRIAELTREDEAIPMGGDDVEGQPSGDPQDARGKDGSQPTQGTRESAPEATGSSSKGPEPSADVPPEGLPQGESDSSA